MNHKVFVVPHDFTPVADVALNHAIATAKTVNARIYLLHVVSKTKEIEDLCSGAQRAGWFSSCSANRIRRQALLDW